MPGYVFVENGTKPNIDKYLSRDMIKLDNVSKPCLKVALSLGYDVYFGVNRFKPQELICYDLPVKMYESHTYRSIVALKDNFIAIRNLAHLVKKEKINVIHCNSPIGGMVGRLVGRFYNVDTIIYTAHGFHFFKGAPLFNNIILKLAEYIMARWTDIIITMNEEDYANAKKMKVRPGGKVYKVHGVGISLDDYSIPMKYGSKIRKELGFNENDILCVSAGDLVKRKNYEVAIKAIAKTKEKNIHYIICGTGNDQERLERLTKQLGIEKQIHFLGFRSDIKNIMLASDIFLFSSLQEGLPRSLMEAMACGLPCIVSRIRGNVDLIDDGMGGLFADAKREIEFSNNIKKLIYDIDLRNKMGNYNKEKIKEYDIKIVEKEIEKIYKDNLI